MEKTGLHGSTGRKIAAVIREENNFSTKNGFSFFVIIFLILFMQWQPHAAVPNITWGPIDTLFTAGDIGEYCADNNPGVIKIDSTRFDWFFMVSNYTYTILRGPAEKPNDSIRKHLGSGLGWVNRNGVPGRPWIIGTYKIDSTGDIYGLMHLELIDEDGGYPCRYRMGIGKSTDGGLNWIVQGTIITQYNEQKGEQSNNIQGSGVVVKDGFMYTWYYDRSTDRLPATARCAMSDVLAGRTDKWFKYYNGSFSEPGLGGNFTPLNTGMVGSHSSVSYNTYLNKFVCAFGWLNQSLVFSDDGITWGDIIPVEPGDNGATQLYTYSVITTPGYKETTSGRFFDVSYWGFFHPYPRDRDTRYVRRFYIDTAIVDTPVALQLLDAVTKAPVTTLASIKLLRSSVVVDTASGHTGIFNLSADSGSDYTVNVSADGYLPASVSNVVVEDGKTTRVTIQCTRLPLVGIDIQPDTAAMLYNSQKQLALNGIYSDGTLMLLDGSVVPVWTSGDTDKVSVNGSGLLSSTMQDGTCVVYASISSLGISDSILVTAASVLFQYTRDFSSTQGQNQCYYQYWNGNSYMDMTWNAADNSWHGNEQYLLLEAGAMHPGNNGDAVLKWVPPQTCKIRITGTVRKSNLNGGDGIQATIKKDAATIWGPTTVAWNDAIGASQDLYLQINAGEAIYFIVNRNGDNGYDGTAWDPVITLDKGIHIQDEVMISTPTELIVTPNPFNPSVNIQVAGWRSGTELKILNVSGKVVVDLTKVQSSGMGQRQIVWNAAGQASGVYLIMLKTGKTQMKQKVMLIQ